MATFIDIALLACIILTLVSGAKNGFFRELFSLFGLGAGLLVGLRFTTVLLDGAPAFLRHSGFAWALLFTILFLLSFALLSLAGRALASAWEGGKVPGVSRLLGLFLGGVRGYLLAVFLAGVIVMISPGGSPTLGRSRVLPLLGGGLRRGADALLPPPTRDRLLRRWEQMPFGADPKVRGIQSGEPV